MRFVLRLLVSAASLWAAVRLVEGITFTGEWWHLFAVALVFGLVNALIRPLIVLLTCPLVVLTLGIFLLVLNGLMLWLTSALSASLGLGFHVSGFWAAFWGALVVGIVSAILNVFVGDSGKKK